MNYGIYYNNKTIGDVLIIVIIESMTPNKIIKSNNVIMLYKDDTLIGINIFNISKTIKIHANGFIPYLDKEVHQVINYILKNEGLDEIPFKEESGFKVAKIIDIEEHPDSEHLHVCKVDVGEGKILQIVCGSYNAKKDLKIVCALPFTFMPSGKQIIPNKLLGIESTGMLCSGKELGLSGYENKKGLYILDDSYTIGEDFFKHLNK